MNNFFENHIDEINLISNRSKKEARTTISRLQKASVLNLSLINNSIIENNIKSLEGINIHQHTDEGNSILGSSDRMYLPDVATRLYQGLDNILKSYKSHKVHKGLPKPKYFDESISYIENLDVSDWDIEYLTTVLTELYNSLSENTKKMFDIHLNLDGRYCFWTMFNTDIKNIEFDEFNLVLFYGIAQKGSVDVLMNGSKVITAGEIRNRRINVDDVRAHLEFYSESLLREFKNIEKDDITPDLIYVDSNSASEMLSEMLNAERNVNLDLKKNCSEGSINETFDKFGNKICEEDHSPLRQSFFNSKPIYNIRNVNVNGVDKNEEEESILDLEKLVQDLRQKTKKQKFLLLFGSRNNSKNESNHSQNILEPGMKVYFDGNNFFNVDFDFLDYTELDGIDFEKSNKTRVIHHPSSQSKFSISGLANALFSLSEKVKLI